MASKRQIAQANRAIEASIEKAIGGGKRVAWVTIPSFDNTLMARKIASVAGKHGLRPQVYISTYEADGQKMVNLRIQLLSQ